MIDAPTHRDPTGSGGVDLGGELDRSLLWKIDVHWSLRFGWFQCRASSFIDAAGLSKDADLFYLQYKFTF